MPHFGELTLVNLMISKRNLYDPELSRFQRLSTSIDRFLARRRKQPEVRIESKKTVTADGEQVD